MKRAIPLLLVVACCTEARGVMITVDFEAVDIPSLMDVGDGTPGEEQVDGGVFEGFRFTETPRTGLLHLIDDGGCSVGCAASGDNSLLYEGFHRNGQPPLVIRHATGLPFRLVGLDVAEAFPTTGPRIVKDAVAILLRGFTPAGDRIDVVVDLDGIADGPGGTVDFESVSLPIEFASETVGHVAVFGVYGDGRSRAGFQVDNLLFDVQGQHVSYTRLNVPEPSAWSLAALLAIVVWRNDRKCVKRHYWPPAG